MADEPKAGEMPETSKPETAKGETPPAMTAEQLQAKIKELETHAANKEQEATRVQKKLAAFEKAEEERKAAAMTESEKAAAKLKEYESKLAQMEHAALVRKVADEAGLPAALADRLQGSTEDELKADAAKLLELMPAKQTKSNLSGSPTNPGNAQRVETNAEKRTRLMGTQIGPFDKGGGINWGPLDQP